MNDVEKLKALIDGAKRIVFFGGAGVSTESGIPDFRSEKGLYKAQQEYGLSPEAMISHSFFVREPDIFYKYYKENLIYQDAKPNAAHLGLAAIERGGAAEGSVAGADVGEGTGTEVSIDAGLGAGADAGKGTGTEVSIDVGLSAGPDAGEGTGTSKDVKIVTQNIDGLHQAAGSGTVYELHGSVHRNYCLECGEKYGLDYILDPANCVAKGDMKKTVPDTHPRNAQKEPSPVCGTHKKNRPRCASSERTKRTVPGVRAVPWCGVCGGMVRPDVVLYEEGLDRGVVEAATEAIAAADLLVVGGTSLIVYPAAGFLNYFRGDALVLINMSETSVDGRADLVIRRPIGEVFAEMRR